MSEERPSSDSPSSDRHGERDSQLSAMFDGELSAAECELLARRLARDEALRNQWSRYALIGAAVRAERGVKLDDRVARRVQAAVFQEASYGDAAAADVRDGARSGNVPPVQQGARVSAYERWLRYSRPVVGAGIAASVAAMSIFWLRTQGPAEDTILASAAAPDTQIVLTPESEATVAQNPAPVAAVRAEETFASTPEPSTQTSIAPPARLANYVVAHSEYSGPLSRRLALSGLVAGEAAADSEPVAAKPATAEQNPAAAGQKKVASDAP